MKYENENSNDDAQKIKFFSDLFASVFLKSNQADQDRTCGKKVYNHVNIRESKILQILSKLETSNACGPDNIGNLVLKPLKILTDSVKAALSKDFFHRFGI